MLEESLRRHLVANDSLEKLIHLLRQYKLAGGHQQEAVRTLVRIRPTVGEQKEDIVLESLDVATGFCAPYCASW
jgi:hypothetical protein